MQFRKHEYKIFRPGNHSLRLSHLEETGNYLEPLKNCILNEIKYFCSKPKKKNPDLQVRYQDLEYALHVALKWIQEFLIGGVQSCVHF